ncbi:3-oxoadipate enol-lactonase [Thermoflexales bacterium]|nr:3-oxoadipate enol-lactonase [Thermoflexales bacterium]
MDQPSRSFLIMPYLDLGSERIYYALQRNQAAGVPVLLIHGAGENHLIWPSGLRRLPGASVYAIDLPGHGKSSGTGRGTIADYAEWLAAFCAALRLPTAVLIGHSMGGAIAQWLALTHSDRTAALVLVATGAKLRVAPQLLEQAQNDFAAAVDLVSDWGWGPAAPEELKRLGKQQLLANIPAVMLTDYRACDAFDVRGQLKAILAPTLIIAGEADQMTPLKHAAFLAEHIPLAHLTAVPGAGHMVMLEAAEIVTDAIRDFLRENRLV